MAIRPFSPKTLVNEYDVEPRPRERCMKSSGMSATRWVALGTPTPSNVMSCIYSKCVVGYRECGAALHTTIIVVAG